MPNLHRRSILTGGVTLAASGAVVPFGSVSARDDEESNDGFELAVSTTDSTSALEGYVGIRTTVTNHGDEPASVPITLDVADIDREFEPLELDAGQQGATYASIEAECLGSGTHDWTVTAGGETATGTVTVDADAGSTDEAYENLELAVDVNEDATVQTEAGADTARIEFGMTIANRIDESVSIDGTLLIDAETTSIPVRMGSCGSQYVFYTVELGAGEYDWTVVLGDETETGTLTVEC